MDIKEHFQKQSIPYTSVRTIELFCTDFLLILVQRITLRLKYNGLVQSLIDNLDLTQKINTFMFYVPRF